MSSLSCRRLAVQHLQQTGSSQATLLDRQHAVAHDDRQQHAVAHDEHAVANDDNSEDEDDENMDVCVVDDKPEVDLAQSDSAVGDTESKTPKDTAQSGNYNKNIIRETFLYGNFTIGLYLYIHNKINNSTLYDVISWIVLVYSQ